MYIRVCVCVCGYIHSQPWHVSLTRLRADTAHGRYAKTYTRFSTAEISTFFFFVHVSVCAGAVFLFGDAILRFRHQSRRVSARSLSRGFFFACGHTRVERFAVRGGDERYVGVYDGELRVCMQKFLHGVLWWRCCG